MQADTTAGETGRGLAGDQLKKIYRWVGPGERVCECVLSGLCGWADSGWQWQCPRYSADETCLHKDSSVGRTPWSVALRHRRQPDWPVELRRTCACAAQCRTEGFCMCRCDAVLSRPLHQGHCVPGADLHPLPQARRRTHRRRGQPRAHLCAHQRCQQHSHHAARQGEPDACAGWQCH